MKPTFSCKNKDGQFICKQKPGTKPRFGLLSKEIQIKYKNALIYKASAWFLIFMRTLEFPRPLAVTQRASRDHSRFPYPDINFILVIKGNFRTGVFIWAKSKNPKFDLSLDQDLDLKIRTKIVAQNYRKFDDFSQPYLNWNTPQIFFRIGIFRWELSWSL